MAFTESITQRTGFPAADLPPLNRASNTNNTNIASCWFVGPLDMSIFRRAFGKISTGVVVGASCTISAYFMASANSNTSNTTSWTQVAGGPSVTINANMMGTIEMRTDQMPSGSRYLALLVNNQCASLFQAELFGQDSDQKPASNQNLNTTTLIQAVY